MLSVSFGLLSFYHFWNLVQINKKVSTYLLSRVAPFIEGIGGIEKIELGFGNFRVVGLNMLNPEGEEYLSVAGIIIDYSPVRFFKSGFSAAEAVTAIKIVSPHMKIFLRGGGGSAFVMPQVDLSGFPVEQLSIFDGQISFVYDSVKVSEFSGINGSINMELQKNRFHFKGRFFGSDYPAAISGSISDLADEYDVSIKMGTGEIKESLVLGRSLLIDKGEVLLDFNISKKTDGEPEINGLAEVTGGELLVFPLEDSLRISELNASVRIDSSIADVIRIEGKFEEAPFSLTGSAGKVGNLEPDLKYNHEGFPIRSVSTLLSRGKAETLPFGKFSAEVDIKGPADSLVFDFGIESARAGQDGFLFEDILLSGGFRGGVFKVRGGSFVLNGMKGSLSGSLPVDSGSASGKEKIKVDLYGSGEYLSFKWRGGVNAFISGSLKEAEVRVNTNLAEFSRNKTEFGRLGFKAAGNKERIKISGGFTDYSQKFNGVISPQKKSMNLSGNIVGFERYFGPSVPLVSSSSVKLNGEFSLKASEKNISLNGALKGNGRRVDAAMVFSVSGSAGKYSGILESDNFVLNGEPLKLNILLNSKKVPEKGLNIDIEDAGGIKGEIFIPKDTLEQIDGRLYSKDITLSKIFGVAGLKQKDLPTGDLGFLFYLSGTRKSPLISGRLSLSGEAAGERISASTDLKFSSGYLSISKGTLFAGKEKKIAFSDFLWSRQRISGRLNWNKIDLGLIGSIVKGPLSGLEGLASGSLDYTGSEGKVSNRVKIEADGLRLGKLKLNDLSCRLSGNGENMKIIKFSARSDGVQYGASGEFPSEYMFGGASETDKSLNITMSFDGNIMRDFAPLVGVIENQSFIHLKGRMNFVGTPGNLFLRRGAIKNKSGRECRIFLKTFLPSEDGVLIDSLDVSVTRRGFVSVRIDADNDGEKFTIINTEAEKGLKPLDIPSLGVSLGVFRLIPPEHGGLTMNIPVFMKRDAVGNITPEGNEGREYFCFAGPLENPVVAGRIIPDNARFTFPPPKKKKKKKDPASFINWRLDIKAGRNMVYFYEYEVQKGIFTYPFVEANVSPGSEIKVRGIRKKDGLRVMGNCFSRRGKIFHYGLFWDVDEITLEMDGMDKRPVMSASAYYNWRNSEGFNERIELKMMFHDPETGAEYEKGRFSKWRLVVVGNRDFVTGLEEPQSSVFLKLLGFEKKEGQESSVPENALRQGGAIIGKMAGSSLTNMSRKVIQPIEQFAIKSSRRIFRSVGMEAYAPEIFKIESDMGINYVTSSIFDSTFYGESTAGISRNRLAREILKNSSVVVGKYLTRSLFLKYSGSLSMRDSLGGEESFVEGIRQSIGLEYQLGSVFQFGLGYDFFDPAYGGFDPAGIRNLRLDGSLRFPFRTFIDGESRRNEKGD